MPRTALPTGYATLTRREARVVLAATVVAMAIGVGVTLSPLASSNYRPDRKGPGDVQLYWAIVDRVHNGEGYHRALAAELTARGYPTRSVFNWRTPLPMWLLGKMPEPAFGKVLLGGLAAALLLLSIKLLVREENKNLRKPVLCASLMVGAVQPAFIGDLIVMPVLWAGIFIALSLCAYGLCRPNWGIALGLAAMFFRELALPYCMLSAVLAWRRGRRREVAAWMLGLAAWLAFFAWHWWEVSGLIAPGARAHRYGWIQFGGLPFVISTAQMNAYLVLLPQWVTAIYLVAAIVGFAGWQTPLGARVGLSAGLYLVAFAVVGQVFNQYWGLLIGPLLCFGAARFPASLGDLYKAAKTATS